MRIHEVVSVAPACITHVRASTNGGSSMVAEPANLLVSDGYRDSKRNDGHGRRIRCR